MWLHGLCCKLWLLCDLLWRKPSYWRFNNLLMVRRSGWCSTPHFCIFFRLWLLKTNVYISENFFFFLPLGEVAWDLDWTMAGLVWELMWQEKSPFIDNLWRVKESQEIWPLKIRRVFCSLSGCHLLGFRLYSGNLENKLQVLFLL